MNNSIIETITLMKKVFALGIFTFLAIMTKAQDTVYVYENASGANDGSSWTDAYTSFGDAFASIHEGDEVWVAKGHYSTSIPALYGGCVSFPVFIRDGISIYGSLDINEDPHVDTRDFENNASIFEGVVGQPHLTLSQVDALAPATILDGLRFTGDGTGLLISSGTIELHNCEFAEITGHSALAINDADVSVYNTTFMGNEIMDFGAIVLVHRSSDVSFENCWFIENEIYAPVTLFSGVLLSTASTVDFTNCIFRGNEAMNEHALQNNSSVPTLTLSDVSLTNCSFSDNPTSVGDISIYYDEINAYNSIVFDDSDIDFIDATATTLTLDHSIVPTGYTGTDLIHSDPQMTGSSLELCSTSPALDEGSNGFNATSFDIDGDTRIPTGTTIDIGAQEGSVSCPTPFQDPLSILEGPRNIGVRAYPNPVSQQLYFELPETAQSAALFDLQGRILLSASNLNEGVHSFNLSDFEDGVYLLSIETASGSDKITIVKQH